MSPTNGLTNFLNSSLSVEYETPLEAWKHSLDLVLTIRLTRGEDDSQVEGKSLSNLSVIETGQVALWDLARKDVCPSLYWSFLRLGIKTDMYSLKIETSLTVKLRISSTRKNPAKPTKRTKRKRITASELLEI